MVICCMVLAFQKGQWQNVQGDMMNPSSAMPEDRAKRLLEGYYSSVVELVRMMRSGTKAKRKLDFIIDHNSDMQNIREVIYHYHVGVNGSMYPRRQQMPRKPR